ncbi:MAG: hypothetical protein AAGN35_18750 [Bacteroidota bacterium]
MTDYVTLDAELTQSLTEAILEGANALSSSSDSQAMVDDLITLVDGIPYLRAPEWETAHRNPLANLMAIHSGTAPVVVPDGEPFWHIEMKSGNHGTYKEAFFRTYSANEVSDRVFALTHGASEAINENWWGNYNVPILTDAIADTYEVYVDTGRISSELDRYNQELQPALSATVQGVYEKGYPPTSGPFAALQSRGEAPAAALLLDEAITNGQFTNNVNALMNNLPDGPPAATWFLFNLWISLKALGYGDVDAAITRYQSDEVGLIILPEIAPYNWWNGEYTSWYSQMSGSVVGAARSNFNSSIHCDIYSNQGGVGSPPGVMWHDIRNGYGITYCEISAFSWYSNGDRRWEWE